MADWDCPHCEDHSIVKESAKDHLIEEHRDELAESFAESNCNNCQSCSSRLSPDRSAPLICPECGHDHANYWAGMSHVSLWDI